jgi:hypothetical protein
MKKLAMLIVAIAALSMLVASVSIADVSAPPVNQLIGKDDKIYSDWETSDCLGCHQYFGSNPDKHHMLYGSAMPDGFCSATEDGLSKDCYTDADCVTGNPICSNYNPGRGDTTPYCTIDPVTGDNDCPRSYQHPECTTTPYCSGTSAAANVPGSQDNGGFYGCLTCHAESTVGNVTNFIVERDCMVCHVQLPNSPSVHHLDEAQDNAKAGNCVNCHGSIVDDMNSTHTIPTYDPSLVTPGSVTTALSCSDDHVSCDEFDLTSSDKNTCIQPTCDAGACSNAGWGAPPCTTAADCAVNTCDYHKVEPATAGSCDFCHAAGTDTASGVAVVSNYDAHHGTGIYKDRYGNSVDLGTGNDRVICGWCHYTDYPHNPGAMDPIEIRTCENCHGMESLHSIQADSNGDGIVVGGELAGYGHVGEDTPGFASDCWGCHGFSMSSASAPGSEVIAPTISGSNTNNTVIADTDSTIAILGNALKDALIELTPALGGDVIVITPVFSATTWTAVTINVPAGTYKMVANNSGEKSGEVSLTATPDTGIAIISIATSCGECEGTVTITGSGFGAEIPSSVQSFMGVVQDGIELTIVSWTDTKIVASGAAVCDGGAVTVNGLFGSATK